MLAVSVFKEVACWEGLTILSRGIPAFYPQEVVMPHICIDCNKEVDEVCGDGFCRECHGDLSFEDCVDGTWLARQNIAKGRSVTETKRWYPDARI